MRIRASSQRCRGVALIIVMIAIAVLGILAFGFAYSMNVETKLARNANSEAELEWLGRSGVEYCRWILAEQMKIAGEPYTAMNQVWAGGRGGIATTNTPLTEVEKVVALGRGSFTWTMTDLERKANINIASEPILQQALMLMGVDPTEAGPIVASIQDWIDPDDVTHVQGAESEEYERREPPYEAKNGPMDDISELLLVRGVTPDIFWGLSYTNHPPGALLPKSNRNFDFVPPVTFTSGLVDLFTPLSTGKININTASADVLQLIPGVDPMIAQAIVSAREGEDDGSGLTGPYRAVDQVRRVPEVTMEASRMLAQFCDVRSRTFQVQIDAEIGGYKRQFIGILGCNNPRDIQVLSFYWK
jgi:general secretion pathway protein K